MSPTLGDNFPKEYREEYCERHFKSWAVFRLFSKETTPPKIKRFVVAGINEETGQVAILFINTNPLQNPNLKKEQMLLKSKDRPYLGHDSYLDCSKIYERTISEIKEIFLNDTSAYLDTMSERDISEAKAIIRMSRIISLKTKEKYNLIQSSSMVG